MEDGKTLEYPPSSFASLENAVGGGEGDVGATVHVTPYGAGTRETDSDEDTGIGRCMAEGLDVSDTVRYCPLADDKTKKIDASRLTLTKALADFFLLLSCRNQNAT